MLFPQNVNWQNGLSHPIRLLFFYLYIFIGCYQLCSECFKVCPQIKFGFSDE